MAHQHSASPFDALPNEVLLQIFAALPPSIRTLGRLACVCRSWRELCEDDKLWQRVARAQRNWRQWGVVTEATLPSVTLEDVERWCGIESVLASELTAATAGPDQSDASARLQGVQELCLVATQPQYRAGFLAALDDTDERHSVVRQLGGSERMLAAKQQLWACVLGMHLRAQLAQLLAAAQLDDAQLCAAVAAAAPAGPAQQQEPTADSLRLATIMVRSVQLERMMLLFSSALRRPGEAEASSPTVLAPQLLDALAAEVRAAAAVAVAAPTIEHVMHVLFRVHNFRGNHERYEALSNLLLPTVLASERGIPLTLCAVLSFVARRVGLAVALANTPGHVVAVHVPTAPSERSVLIDAFNGHFCTLSELGASFVEPGEPGRRAVFSSLCSPSELMFTRLVHNMLAYCSVAPGAYFPAHSAVPLLLCCQVAKMPNNTTADTWHRLLINALRTLFDTSDAAALARIYRVITEQEQ